MQIRVVVFGSWKKIFAKMQLLWKEKCSELKMIDLSGQLFYSFPNTKKYIVSNDSSIVMYQVSEIGFLSTSILYASLCSWG